MKIHMKNLERLSLAEMEEFVRGNRKVTLSLEGQAAIYGFVEALLKVQQYRRLSRGQRGVIRRFLTKVSGLSRAQMTRLIAAWMKTRQVRRRPAQRPSFPRRYSHADVVLLAEVDAAHEELSGPATRRILEREFKVFGKSQYQTLSDISVSHIYNLRHCQTYRRCRVRVRHTQRSQVSIAERRKPDPQGKPGYLRVDTVPQGQHDGQPGLYHLNAIDTVTQWEIVGCVETISERHLLPVLEAMLHQFPFRLLGFHCDNGSEFINHQVAALLNKLLVEFTKSRAYRTTDNALVEGKNDAVVRAHRVWTDRRTARRGGAEILHGPSQPLLELPPALWLCSGGTGSWRQEETDLSDRGLSNALRETDFTGRLAAVSEGRTKTRGAATASPSNERYRSRAPDEKGQAVPVGEMPGQVVRPSRDRRLRAPGPFMLAGKEGLKRRIV